MRGPDPLFATRWVHAYEDDSAAGAAYVPDSASLPLSRRPREQIAFRDDGSAVFYQGAPDDRLTGQPACWRDARAAGAAPAAAHARVVITLVERREQRLVVRVEPLDRHGET